MESDPIFHVQVYFANCKNKMESDRFSRTNKIAIFLKGVNHAAAPFRPSQTPRHMFS